MTESSKSSDIIETICTNLVMMMNEHQNCFLCTYMLMRFCFVAKKCPTNVQCAVQRMWFLHFLNGIGPNNWYIAKQISYAPLYTAVSHQRSLKKSINQPRMTAHPYSEFEDIRKISEKCGTSEAATWWIDECGEMFVLCTVSYRIGVSDSSPCLVT